MRRGPWKRQRVSCCCVLNNPRAGTEFFCLFKWKCLIEIRQKSQLGISLCKYISAPPPRAKESRDEVGRCVLVIKARRMAPGRMAFGGLVPQHALALDVGLLCKLNEPPSSQAKSRLG